MNSTNSSLNSQNDFNSVGLTGIGIEYDYLQHLLQVLLLAQNYALQERLELAIFDCFSTLRIIGHIVMKLEKLHWMYIHN